MAYPPVPEGVHPAARNRKAIADGIQLLVERGLRVQRRPVSSLKDSARCACTKMAAKHFDGGGIDPYRSIASLGLGFHFDALPHRPAHMDNAPCEVDVFNMKTAEFTEPQTAKERKVV